jgi:IclR family pca regulon transcriptional regulator
LGDDVPGDPKSAVQSIAKAFRVLQAFAGSQTQLTITDVANAAGLDRGTAFRLIHTLVSLGYVASVPDSRRFRLTLKCLDLGYSALASGGLKAQTAPLLQELVPGHADAASLGMLDGPDVVYVERVQIDMGRLGMDRRSGSRTGAYAAALGHVLLAWHTPAGARAVLESGERVRLSERTLVDIDMLLERLAAVRARGYAVSDIAAPVFGPDQVPVAGISLTVRNERADLAPFIEHALPPLLEVTQALSNAARLTAAKPSFE